MAGSQATGPGVSKYPETTGVPPPSVLSGPLCQGRQAEATSAGTYLLRERTGRSSRLQHGAWECVPT